MKFAKLASAFGRAGSGIIPFTRPANLPCNSPDDLVAQFPVGMHSCMAAIGMRRPFASFRPPLIF